MDTPAFQALVDAAVAALPAQVRAHLADVLIVVEPRDRGGRMLLGLYEGIPLTQWGRDFSGKPPDKITLFQGMIERVAGSEDRVPDVIRETLLHEIAHFLGFDHPDIHRMERAWRRKRGPDR